MSTKLKIKRQEAKVTQAALAYKTGMSLRTLQEYEQGRKPINQAAAITVYRLAKELGVSVGDLLE